MGDYVTTQTRYFVTRDFRGRYPIDTRWRLGYQGYTFAINSIKLLDDQVPYYLEIEATALGGNGAI